MPSLTKGNAGTSREPVAVVPVGYSADQNHSVRAMIATLGVAGVVMAGIQISYAIAHMILKEMMFRAGFLRRESFIQYWGSIADVASLLLATLLMVGALRCMRSVASDRRQLLLVWAYASLAFTGVCLVVGCVQQLGLNLMRINCLMDPEWLLPQLEYTVNAVVLPILLVVLLNRPEFKEAFTRFGPPVEEDAGQG